MVIIILSENTVNKYFSLSEYRIFYIVLISAYYLQKNHFIIQIYIIIFLPFTRAKRHHTICYQTIDKITYHLFKNPP